MNKKIISKKTILPILAGLAVFIILSLPLLQAHYSLFGHEKSGNIFVYLAWAFLHGRLDLIYVPDSQRDLSLFHGKYYAYWPPLPAFLLMPAVCIHELWVGDKWIAAAFTAVSVIAAWFLMDAIAVRRGWVLSNIYKFLLSAFLAFGTANLIMTIRCNQWSFAQTCASMMMMISMSCIVSLSSWWGFLLGGTFWALAILARMHLILAAPLFIYLAAFGAGPSINFTTLKYNWRQILFKIALFSIPVLAVLIFYAWYNAARFGSIFDNGIAYHLMADRFIADYKTYGYISPHYFLHNVYYTILRLPFFANLFTEPGKYNDWKEGYSIFFQSPTFLFAVWALRYLKKDILTIPLWIATVLVSIPILFLMGTGWIQFGARYLFDLCPFLFPLVIIGSRGKISPLLVISIAASIASNLYGLKILEVLYP